MSETELNAFLDTYVDPSITLDTLLMQLPSIDFKPEEENVVLIHLQDDLKEFLLSRQYEFIKDLSTSMVILPTIDIAIKKNFILYKMLYHYYTYGLLRHRTSITSNPKYAYYKLDIVIHMNQYLQNVVEQMQKQFKA